MIEAEVARTRAATMMICDKMCHKHIADEQTSFIGESITDLRPMLKRHKTGFTTYHDHVIAIDVNR